MYSWSRFGRDAEYIVALYLKSKGWSLRLSKGSRGPADIIATRQSARWFIQVKSSTKIPRLKGYEVKRLYDMARLGGGLAVISTLQPSLAVEGIVDPMARIGCYIISFYSLDDWQRLDP